jgi:hypothetical protein
VANGNKTVKSFYEGVRSRAPSRRQRTSGAEGAKASSQPRAATGGQRPRFMGGWAGRQDQRRISGVFVRPRRAAAPRAPKLRRSLEPQPEASAPDLWAGGRAGRISGGSAEFLYDHDERRRGRQSFVALSLEPQPEASAPEAAGQPPEPAAQSRPEPP